MLTNNLGLAEDVSLSVDVGSKSSTEFAIGFTKPRLYGKPINSTITLHQQNRSYQSYTSYSEQLRGVSAMLFRCAAHVVSLLPPDYDSMQCKISCYAISASLALWMLFWSNILTDAGSAYPPALHAATLTSL